MSATSAIASLRPERLEFESGVRMTEVDEGVTWVVREDCVGLGDSLVQGNKVRKLAYILKAAAPGSVVVAVGGEQSNFVRVTVAWCRRLGLLPVAVLRPTHVAGGGGCARCGDGSSAVCGEPTGNALVTTMLAERVVAIAPEVYAIPSERAAAAAAAGQQVAADRGLSTDQVLVMPEGGSSALGAWGYVELYAELVDQLAAGAAGAGPASEVDLVLAVGSGGTLAGLLLGEALLRRAGHTDLPTLVAFSVCDSAQHFRSVITDIFTTFASSHGLADLTVPACRIDDSCIGDGYGIPLPGEVEAIRALGQRTGILLDPVYSGKAYMGLMSLSTTRGRRRLFLATGGLLGLLGHSADFAHLTASTHSP
jgi:1-aminocyclopropane-1-carboxylate deaminase/D-cysteine desulfhydrase-like pyridoxal-dependent ACC family enzyme